MTNKRRKLRLSLMTRLLLCFALGGVLINGTVWYKLTLDPQAAASAPVKSGPRPAPSGLSRGGPPPSFSRALRPGGPPPKFPPSGGGPPPFPPPQDYASDQRPSGAGLLPHYRPMMVQEARELIRSLEHADDLDEARALAKKAGLDVRREAPAEAWATRDSLAPWSAMESESEPFAESGDFSVGTNFVSLRQGAVRWIVYFPAEWKPSLLSDIRFRWLLVGQFSFVVLFCLVFGLWQLKPLRSLERGVRQIAQGNFGHQVPVEQESELGDLARTLNWMSAEVKSLMEAKDELLAGISHELRSPLTRMRLAIHVERTNALPRIERDIVQMDKLIGEILESSRWQNRTPELRGEWISLSELFQELADQYSGRSPGLHVEALSGPSIWADRDRLLRVLVNLVENALKYSGHDSGPVRLEGKKVPGGWEIAVRDHGPGVPEKALSRIFDAYYRVDPSKPGGYGLGLSLCKKIAEAHGGTIRASNLSSGGLEVILFLPQEGQAKAA